jgi:predicted  nucleic acid-binding Zn-ribbon protein
MTTNRWKDVFSTAPSILEEAKKLWTRVVSKDARVSRPKVQAAAASGSEALSAIDVKFDSLEQKTKLLEDEAVSSFDVVRLIAQQHSQLSEQHMRLVEAVDGVLDRMRALQWICGMLALALLAILVLLIAR